MVKETRFQELKRYVRLDDRDAQLLREFGELARAELPRIAREFYDRIREHEDAHAVFTGEAQIERLERSMVRWMDRLLSGVYDEAYHEQTLVIGRVHVRVGLPQRYMLTAMALIRVALEEIAQTELVEEAGPARRALTRLLDLELAIMLESYREDLTAQLARRDLLAAEGLRTDLARAVRLYEAALDVTPNVVVGIDGTGAIRLFNRAAIELTGHAHEDVIGAPFVATLVAVDAQPNDGPLVASLLTGPPRHVDEESTIQTRSGKVRAIRWRFTHIADGALGDITLFAVGTDITDLQASQERVQRHERLAAVGTLAAGLAHEIRNPLNGAQLHVAFLQRALQKRGDDPDMLDAARVVSEEIKRLANLVAEFLDFARPSSLTRRPAVVQALAGRVVELTAEEARAAGVAVVLDAPPQDLVLFADGAKLQQVLLNLVQNAIEALAPGGHGHVVLRARRQPRNVVLEVEDDGPGLSSPDAPVFDAFFSTKPSGTGLGLAIAHRIVTDHGGTLDVDSRPGRTCFRVTIPIGLEADRSPQESP
jgi:PAS domain S-box-containing protein